MKITLTSPLKKVSETKDSTRRSSRKLRRGRDTKSRGRGLDTVFNDPDPTGQSDNLVFRDSDEGIES